MKDGKLEKDEVALPKLVETSVHALNFELDSTKKQLTISATIKVDVSKAQFEGDDVKIGNYVFKANNGSISSGATPEINFAPADNENTVKLKPKEILTKGFKHTGGI